MHVVSAAASLLLVALAAVPVRPQNAAGTIFEAISTFAQCTSRTTEPACIGPEGYTSITINQSPGVQDDAIIQVDLASSPIGQVLNATLADPLKRENGSDGSSTATSNVPIGFDSVFLFVGSTNVRCRYPMMFVQDAPTSYRLRFTAGGGPAQANLCQGQSRLFPNISTGLGTVQNCLGGASGIPPTSPVGLVLPSQVGGTCCYVTCGICNANSGGCDLRDGLNAETHDWVAPLWYAWRLQPMPIYEWTATVRIVSATTGTTIQELSVGLTNAESPATQGGHSDEDPTTGTDTTGAGRQFTTVAFSTDRRVRFELLSVEAFGAQPWQDGWILTRESGSFANCPGGVSGSQGVYANPFETCCARTDCSIKANFDACSAPSPCWLWGRQNEQNVYIGRTCGDLGIRPQFYCDKKGRDRVCFDCHGTCVPGIDYWSATKQAILPDQMIELNTEWHDFNVATGATQAWPYRPDYLENNSGRPATWIYKQSMFYTPPAQGGVRARYNLRIAGSVVRIIREIPKGTLEPVQSGPNCTLVLNDQGLLSVLACNNLPGSTFPGTYVVQTNCSSSDYVIDSANAFQTVTVQPGTCRQVDVKIVLAGAQVSPTLRGCTVSLFTTEQEEPLATLGSGCVEREKAFLGALGEFLQNSVKLNNCAGDAYCQASNFLKVMLILAIVAAAIIFTLFFLRKCTACAGSRR
jgi:hypothetical protein